MFTPFHQATYKRFIETVQSQNWEHSVILKNKVTGKLIKDGNSDIAEEFVKNKNEKEKRESLTWMPNKPISKMQCPLKETLACADKVRKYSSILLTELLQPKQRQGHVSTFIT